MTMYSFSPHPIVGQEAICPDGLGRVIAYNNVMPNSWVQVQTYVNDRSCKWDFKNVVLIEPGERVRMSGFI